MKKADGHAGTTLGGSPMSRLARLSGLTIGSIGVVYGDIGTSPLYAFREALKPAARDGLTPDEVIGTVSLILWALILVVSLKYVLFLLRLSNRGEGGILALYALIQGAAARRSSGVFLAAILGAALFFADGVITPAISVLSAVEGLTLTAPWAQQGMVPAALAILVLLFLFQGRGTGRISSWFGPVMTLWFLTIAVSGACQVWAEPMIVAAVDPRYAIVLLLDHWVVAAAVFGGVFLAVTGAEALYADLGHFGCSPIQTAWFGLVFPALMLNYFGQGALVLADPTALRSPFFLLAPDAWIPALVGLSTAASVVASQAIISGAFSLARQSVQLGLLPRLEIRHTSASERGQIYLPSVNWALLIGVLAVVLIFGDSSSLASAYGIAVSGAMIATTALAAAYLRWGRNWSTLATVAAVAPIAVLESGFVAANLFKLGDGAWLPLALSGALATAMWTWSKGTVLLSERTRQASVPLVDFVRSMARTSARTASGTAVFLTGEPTATPSALLHNLKHNGVLHERIVVLTVVTAEEPRIEDAGRARVEPLDRRFQRLELRFGFMETPDVPRALALCGAQGLDLDSGAVSFFLGRRKLVADSGSGLPGWQDRIFIALAAFAADPSDFYRLPPDRVVNLGTQMPI